MISYIKQVSKGTKNFRYVSMWQLQLLVKKVIQTVNEVIEVLKDRGLSKLKSSNVKDFGSKIMDEKNTHFSFHMKWSTPFKQTWSLQLLL